MKKKIITCPIYYANANFHIGTLHTSVLADIFTRFFKMLNYDVLFSIGLDEHGQKVMESAGSENVMDYLDKKALVFKEKSFKVFALP